MPLRPRNHPTPPTPPTLRPTPEQDEAVRLFNSGGTLLIRALAGTGKSSTMFLMAKSTPRRGQYVVFNRQAALDAEKKAPSTLDCRNAHRLAYAAVGSRYGYRISGERVKAAETAAKLKIGGISLTTPFSKYKKLLEPWRCASITRRAVLNFCQSADKDLGVGHFPYLEGLDEDKDRDRPNNRVVATELLEPARRLWADWLDPRGWSTYDQSAYLKQWELHCPRIDADYVLCDEAQDLSPVLLSIVEQQGGHAQLVLCGDQNQAIYGFTGALDALDKVHAENECSLTRSFRSGAPICDVANALLARIPGNDLRLVPADKVSSVGFLGAPRAILSRSNASAIAGVLEDPKKRHLVGGGNDIIYLVEQLEMLRQGRKPSHPEITCFDTWDELQAYTETESGEDLKLVVGLVNKFGGARIGSGLRQMPVMEAAETVYSTTHKVKGLEFDTVKVAGDFKYPMTPKCFCGHAATAHLKGMSRCFTCEGDCKSYREKPVSPETLRLVYVAVTRAQTTLDISELEGLL
jgi:hypothetical protein